MKLRHLLNVVAFCALAFWAVVNRPIFVTVSIIAGTLFTFWAMGYPVVALVGAIVLCVLLPNPFDSGGVDDFLRFFVLFGWLLGTVAGAAKRAWKAKKGKRSENAARKNEL